MKRILCVLCVLIVLAGLVLGFIHWKISGFEKRSMPGAGKQVAVVIPRGAGPQVVARILAKAKVVASAKTFYLWMRYVKGTSGEIKSGKLAFCDNMTPCEVECILIQGTPVTYKITIPEGLRIDEIALLFEQEGFIKADEFNVRARDNVFAHSLDIPSHTFEGFLFPETYYFRKDTRVDEIITTMVECYKQTFTLQLRNQAKNLGLSELKAVILASIIEKETGAKNERALISSVFHNRLKMGWKLQTDPTVIYAIILETGSFNGNLTLADLELDHPYNTYRNSGLPPGPICNPGARALLAALYPAQTNYKFFVSRNDGTHVFCANLKCHNRAVDKYQGTRWR